MRPPWAMPERLAPPGEHAPFQVQQFPLKQRVIWQLHLWQHRNHVAERFRGRRLREDKRDAVFREFLFGELPTVPVGEHAADTVSLAGLGDVADILGEVHALFTMSP